ncbi:MAG: antitoxin [Rhodanobacter sp.]|nr:MAG: antitoxin [Rhodanobacter sp.]
MQSKLTLRIDERLIRRAKQQAQARGTSVSALVAGYFIALGAEQNGREPTPIAQRLRGVLHDASVSRETYREHLQEKHEIQKS